MDKKLLNELENKISNGEDFYVFGDISNAKIKKHIHILKSYPKLFNKNDCVYDFIMEYLYPQEVEKLEKVLSEYEKNNIAIVLSCPVVDVESARNISKMVESRDYHGYKLPDEISIGVCLDHDAKDLIDLDDMNKVDNADSIISNLLVDSVEVMKRRDSFFEKSIHDFNDKLSNGKDVVVAGRVPYLFSNNDYMNDYVTINLNEKEERSGSTTEIEDKILMLPPRTIRLIEGCKKINPNKKIILCMNDPDIEDCRIRDLLLGRVTSGAKLPDDVRICAQIDSGLPAGVYDIEALAKVKDQEMIDD